MDFFPVFMKINARPCVVVGGGEVAARKTRQLLRAGGEVHVVAPALCQRLQEQVAQHAVVWRKGQFEPNDVAGCALVIAATDDMTVNKAVHAAAVQHNIPVNVVDNPALCSFIMPAVVDRSPVLIAVSSGGAAPLLARLLRARLETLIPAAYGRLATLAAKFRAAVKQQIGDAILRRRFWENILQGPVAEQVFAGQERAAEAALQAALEQASTDTARGEVYLVGAGPGDPDLLTFRALRLMQQADVVLYDRLIPDVILNLVRTDAERIYVGKRRSEHTLRQEMINQLLVQHARAGKRVLRLKGGDPFIFGRGGEEIATLAEEGIPFQVVPGITAASGCAAYAGIPLTHREYAQSCVFVTGQLKDGGMALNWAGLIQPQQTIVVYMGLAGVDILCRELIAHGLPAATPSALVEQGTTPRQRVLTGTLETLPGIISNTDVHAPTLIIVGDVVRLHDRLAWFNLGH
ncbi:MAG: siroheme synthase CysG [Gammaproteobacteria bacterium]|nr:siroheme synthase CysG [Gammaproteobacteria bacterium]